MAQYERESMALYPDEQEMASFYNEKYAHCPVFPEQI